MKRRRIIEMIRINNIGFLAIQETKLEVITESLCCSLWGSSDCDWVFLPSEGRSGGILSIWSDFNAVCRGEERSGINNADGVTSTEIIEFHHFLEELELVDLPLLGRRFTWYQASGRAMSKIDRILISDEWASIWGNGSLWALPRDVSDHCPLILKYSHQECGPKPFSVEGWIGFVLKEELKGLKFVLREWNNLEYGGMEARIGGLVMEIQDLDSKGETMGLSRQEVSSRNEKFGELWKFLKSKEALIFQISRSKWLKEGDCNTKFFHGCIKARSKLNSISAIRVDDVWLESPDQIKAVVSSFFANHVSDTPRARPKLDGVVFPMLSEDENFELTSPFSLDEIELVVKHSDGDIRIMFDQFHGNACLPKSLLSYFVTLIPKVNSPSSISDFRPISLLGFLYKLIAKVLEKILAKVIDSFFTSNQLAFIKGRNLVDSVLVVNEVLEMAKKSRRDCLIFKVDFEKAYDSVDWDFLEYMLHRSVFAKNGLIGSGNGLTLVEGFSGVMRKVVELDMFKGFSLGRTPVVISHLQYADDTLCIEEASVNNLWSLKAILRVFEMASGLKVNFWKSGLMGVNVSSTFMEMTCTFLNCRFGSIPFKYLGLPIGANPRRISTWDPLLEHLRVRGGKNICWVKWSVVCKEKSQGGLGVQDVRIVNFSLLSKWRWRLLQPGLPLWKAILVAKYGNHILHSVDLSNSRVSTSASNWWKDICALDKVVDSKNWFAESLVRKECLVEEFYSNDGVNGNWSLFWRRTLFQWELDLLGSLKELLEPVRLSSVEDFWRWLPNTDGTFSINSSYNYLVKELRYSEGLDFEAAEVFKQLWESPTPSKLQQRCRRVCSMTGLGIQEIAYPAEFMLAGFLDGSFSLCTDWLLLYYTLIWGVAFLDDLLVPCGY
ncbi:cysteine-rich receptor-like protein kinase [Trifolium pratense]|uniref:Cysteine-rich receptor-like protein kinase n=1 Tax=Trifolium pratense TaxID=57577 RepID=A0A2K3P7C7_TRIPR|nr:cysteine-rich receptor-like protein kinase [Trifolium pratense]